MDNSFFEFTWYVDRRGYDWIDGTRRSDSGTGVEEGKYLTSRHWVSMPNKYVEMLRSPLHIDRATAKARGYQDFFVDFVRLSPTPEAIRTYANGYGLLANGAVSLRSRTPGAGIWFQCTEPSPEHVKQLAEKSGFLPPKETETLSPVDLDKRQREFEAACGLPAEAEGYSVIYPQTEPVRRGDFPSGDRDAYLNVEEGTFHKKGESLTEWKHCIQKLQDAWRLLKLVQGQDTRTLKKSMLWERKRGEVWVRYQPPEGKSEWIISGTADTSDWLAAVQYNDCIAAARLHIQNQINRVLEDHGEIHLLWYDTPKDLRFSCSPQTLWGALWLRLSEVLIGGLDYRVCLYCKKILRVEPGIHNRHVKTCGPTCRTMLWKMRKKENASRAAHGTTRGTPERKPEKTRATGKNTKSRTSAATRRKAVPTAG